VVVAVGASALNKAKDFGKKFEIPEDHCFGSYQELVACPDVDVVYVGTVHTMHAQHATLALNAGKHVLCEKPITINESEARPLFELAHKNNLFLMEAAWSRCFPLYKRVLEMVEQGTLGEISMVEADFGFITEEKVARLEEPDLGGGAILDIGVYTIALTSMVYGRRFPDALMALGSLNEKGVDNNVGILLKYGNSLGVLCCSFKGHARGEAFIVGSKGNIKIQRPFWSPEKIVITMNGQEPVEEKHAIPELKWPREHPDFEFIFANGAGMQYEAREVHHCLHQGVLESPLIPHSESMIIQRIMDNLRTQLGVEYPQEK
jgi:dihydrodiol dehydrogenase / D-xylose 1-dehydrogenase (NADP)